MLKFLLRSATVKKLIKEAQPAKYGWRNKICLDPEVRDVWTIPKSRVKFDKRNWNKTFNPTMDKLKGKLGLRLRGIGVEHRFAANVSGQCKAHPAANGLSS